MHVGNSRDRWAKVTLALGALGVVYGDIGTSPLYAIPESFSGAHSGAPTTQNIYGVLSLVFWALALVIALKYCVFVLRADNKGEGGVFALLALIPRTAAGRALALLGLFGAALLFGDGIITPAISVVSAVEGLEMATDRFAPYVVPITVAILAGLFAVQRFGTGKIGIVFGPVVLIWFAAIAVSGLAAIARGPEILAAVSPVYAVRFFAQNGASGFFVLGAVMLVVTGGEALYADMGHFGKGPIRIGWFAVAMPCLLLNYFGQGALLVERGGGVLRNPFYALAGGWALYPMLFIATAASVIASQAMISGTFSLMRQAAQLGYWPRLRIIHTSGAQEGQIYIAGVNYALMVSCILLVLSFRSSSAIAAAYGIAVTGAMIVTAVLFYAVARHRWGWNRWAVRAITALFLTIDGAFFLANVDKLVHGAWVSIAMAVMVFTVMVTWNRGRAEIYRRVSEAWLPVETFLADVALRKPPRVPGTAVFLASNPDGVPGSLLHHFKHNKVIHEQVVILTVATEETPRVAETERIEWRDLGLGFHRVVARFGFMESPDVVRVLQLCERAGLANSPPDTTYFLGRETLLTSGPARLSRWRKRLFAFLSRNATPPTAYFGIPPNRVVELGAQIEL